MESIRVVGGAELSGRVRVRGAKNSVLKLMAATLMAPGRSILTNVPTIVDVRIMAELLRRLGCRVEHDPGAGVLTIDVPEMPGHVADYELVRAMRASIAVLGPLVARCRRAHVALPGGDAIGSRGLDLHQAGLALMGATSSMQHGYLVAEAPGGLTGADISLAFPSVGATENLAMAASLARGRTVLDNVAREPEIEDLCLMLVGMGADIEGIGTSRLVIRGVEQLRPVEHQVVGDRIAAGTWAFCAATAGGRVEVLGVDPEHVAVALDKLAGAGAEVDSAPGGFAVTGVERPRSIDVATLPYPGFPTDLQPFAVAFDAVAAGRGMITENVFEGRWRFVGELARLGADIQVDGHHALVRGVRRLSGAPVEASDIRAGAALVMAGLRAEGVTEVGGAGHIDRGYESFVEDLRGLGAHVERIREADPLEQALNR